MKYFSFKCQLPQKRELGINTRAHTTCDPFGFTGEVSHSTVYPGLALVTFFFTDSCPIQL